MCDSKLSGLCPFGNMATELKVGQNQKSGLLVYETLILELIFVKFPKNSSVVINDTHRRFKYPHHNN